MTGPIIRILLRVIAGWLMARGMPVEIADVLRDPELVVTLQTLLGAAIWGATELFYMLAKRFGWRT